MDPDDVLGFVDSHARQPIVRGGSRRHPMISRGWENGGDRG
jgi:hypothetical protein